MSCIRKQAFLTGKIEPEVSTHYRTANSQKAGMYMGFEVVVNDTR